jgi:uncharacterized membrane protein SpoIIM required for sporulation
VRVNDREEIGPDVPETVMLDWALFAVLSGTVIGAVFEKIVDGINASDVFAVILLSALVGFAAIALVAAIGLMVNESVISKSRMKENTFDM